MHTSRTGGCTLTGALSVTIHVRNATSIVHGPKGCAHHNFSLFHATLLDSDQALIPDLVSTSLGENEIIFGGEDALARTIGSVCSRNVSAVFVLTTCAAATIGDDVEAVCGMDWPVPVIMVPTAGFLGGAFQDGVNNALTAIAALADPSPLRPQVNLIGEKNLEYEVEENGAEVVRLLSLLGLEPGIRFVHSLEPHAIPGLGSARLNILRDPSLIPVGEFLCHRFGTPYIPSFPSGFSDTITFIGDVAGACAISPHRAIESEHAFQQEILADFADLTGTRGILCGQVTDDDCTRVAREAADALRIRTGNSDGASPLPIHPVVGTSGVKRMLHRWRRAIHA